MKNKFISPKLLASLIFLFSFFFSTFIFAKEIKLYDQPQTDAKEIGIVDLSAGIIPIFTPKTGDWIKVGDPRNGNVGWIKSKDINEESSNSFTFTQRIISDGKGPHSYQVIEFGKPQNVNEEQMQALIKKMQTQQKSIKENMQKTIQNMMNEMNNFYNQTWDTMGWPTAVPIIVVPTTKTEAKPQPATPAVKK